MRRVSIYIGLLLLALMVCSCHKAKDAKSVDPEVLNRLSKMFVTIDADDYQHVLADRNYKAEGSIVILTAENDTVYDGDLEYLKGRGNATWDHPTKKPFNIKFPQKTRLFHLYKSKRYCLLANAYDASQIRNAVAFDVANLIGLPGSSYEYIALYVNEQLLGVYMLTNKVELKNNDLHIANLEQDNERANFMPLSSYDYIVYRNEQSKGCDTLPASAGNYKAVRLDNNPDDITGGYLIEPIPVSLHNYEKAVSGFVSDNIDRVAIRSPKYASVEEVMYIRQFYNEMVEAIRSKSGCNSKGRYYADYIDMESFAKYYLIQEILCNADAGYGSFFTYKDAGEEAKMQAGPVWDFDLSLNNTCFIDDYFTPNELRGIEPKAYTQYNMKDSWLFYLPLHDDFEDMVKHIYETELREMIMDYINTDTIVHLGSFVGGDKSEIDKVNAYLHERMKFFDWYFSTDRSEMVTITDINDGTFRSMYIPKGTCFTLPEVYCGTSPKALIPEWYIVNTDTQLKGNNLFEEDVLIERRYRKPSFIEVQTKRIQNRLRR